MTHFRSFSEQSEQRTKPFAAWQCSLVLVASVLFSFPGNSQAIADSSQGDDRTSSVLASVQGENIVLPALVTADQESAPQPMPQANAVPKPYGWDITLYPALAWVPIFGASVTITAPPTPTNPIVAPSGTTNNSFNGAYFGGARIEKGKWSADALFMWAALEADRKTPLAKVNLDFVFGDAMVGREVVPGLYLEGGVRRLALDVHATVGSDSASDSPGFWDPLVGLTYSRVLGKKWRVLMHGDGGGFGAGTDVDVTATARAEWQFARHFGLGMGYGGMHLSESHTEAGKTVSVSPTMHGPIFGFGLFF